MMLLFLLDLHYLVVYFRTIFLTLHTLLTTNFTRSMADPITILSNERFQRHFTGRLHHSTSIPIHVNPYTLQLCISFGYRAHCRSWSWSAYLESNITTIHISLPISRTSDPDCWRTSFPTHLY